MILHRYLLFKWGVGVTQGDAPAQQLLYVSETFISVLIEGPKFHVKMPLGKKKMHVKWREENMKGKKYAK